MHISKGERKKKKSAATVNFRCYMCLWETGLTLIACLFLPVLDLFSAANFFTDAPKPQLPSTSTFWIFVCRQDPAFYTEWFCRENLKKWLSSVDPLTSNWISNSTKWFWAPYIYGRRFLREKCKSAWSVTDFFKTQFNKRSPCTRAKVYVPARAPFFLLFFRL